MMDVRPKFSGENNRDYSYKLIKDAIMSLKLVPGQSISEIELSELLQISRTPIREVMAKLREENLVEVVPQVGTYVTKIQPKLVEEAMFSRIILEKEVLKLSCTSFSETSLKELRKNIALQELLLGTVGSEKEFHQLDSQFHYLIFQGNNKENIWAAITRLSTHYNRVRLLSEMEYSFDQAVKEHKSILSLIEKQEVKKVEKLVEQHIVEPIKRWENLYTVDSPYVTYFDLTQKMPVF